jgi:hypothetical protein
MRSKAWLAAPVLLAHADVTKNIKYFSMGPKLRHTAVRTHAIVQALVAEGAQAVRVATVATAAIRAAVTIGAIGRAACNSIIASKASVCCP